MYLKLSFLLLGIGWSLGLCAQSKWEPSLSLGIPQLTQVKTLPNHSNYNGQLALELPFSESRNISFILAGEMEQVYEEVSPYTTMNGQLLGWGGKLRVYPVQLPLSFSRSCFKSTDMWQKLYLEGGVFQYRAKVLALRTTDGFSQQFSETIERSALQAALGWQVIWKQLLLEVGSGIAWLPSSNQAEVIRGPEVSSYLSLRIGYLFFHQ